MTLSELIESINIVDYISQFTELEEKHGEFWGLSPLSEEKTPSFSVRAETGQFFDFSSGKGGNILSFIKHYHKCGTKKAEEILKEYAGDKNITVKNKMEAVKVANRFIKRKKQSKEIKTEILSDDYMERYPRNDDKLAIWEREGISRASIDKFQVRYDSFSDRLVYPIRNIDGKIINVSGRTVDKDWKEKGLRKYTYFKQLGSLNTVYGLAENREAIADRSEIIIFEGAKSVMLADTWGVRNTAALLTSHLNPNQLKILAQLGCRTVFALDKGVVIKEDENIKRLKRYCEVEYIFDKDNLLEDKMSPVDRNFEAFKILYKERVRYY